MELIEKVIRAVAGTYTRSPILEPEEAKAAIRAMLDGVEPGSVILRREVFDFLMGVGDLEGVSFGELHEGLPGRFWWRSVLRAAERETSPDALKEAVK